MKEIVVALSGTLETFSLPDVLRLLSSTKKTGLLALDGDRGRGQVWVRDGAIVAADADRAVNDQVEGVAFELLRFADAGFEFHSGAEAAVDGEARDVDEVLAEAETRLAEWRGIEAVVPSLDVWVHMVAELAEERPVTPSQWRVLAQVGTGTTGHALADGLGAGEYEVCSQLRDLVEEGMVELGDAPAPVLSVDVDTTWDRPIDEPTFVEPALDPDAVTSLGADLASFVAVGTVEEAVDVDAEPDPEPVAETEPEPEPERQTEADVDDDEDFLSELSQLSPKAAAAIEATWTEDAAEVSEQDEQPVEEAPAHDVAPAADSDEIDQNLLLRFLSSTKQ